MYTIDSCSAFDMLFHFNFTVNFLKSSDPFLIKQHRRLSSEIFDVLILRDSLENNTREGEFSTIPVVESRRHERKETETGVIPISRD